MSPVQIVGIVVAIAVVLFLFGRLFPKPLPKEKHFQCARCGAVTRHTERTIEAWRNKKSRFFCQACHGKWLQSQPARIREQHATRGARPSGCLSVVVLVAVVPLAGSFLVRAYA